MFFFPLFDDNPSRHTPYISWLIIAMCVLVFVWQQSLGSQGEQYAFYSYGFVPAHVSGAAPLPTQLVVLPAWATAISSMFLHGGLMHICGNMLYLWIFGDNIEDSMGSLKFIIFYILCGMAAAGAQFAIDPASRIPMVGASGGIAGILGAYLILHPKAAIRTLLVILIFIRFINLPAWLVLGVWIGGQFIAVPNALGNVGGGVAYFAHIGGFIAGMVLVPFFKHRDIPLFGADEGTPARWDGQPVPFSTIRAQASAKYRGRRNALGSRVVSPDGGAPAAHQAATDQEGRQKSSPWVAPRRKPGGSVPRHLKKTHD